MLQMKAERFRVLVAGIGAFGVLALLIGDGGSLFVVWFEPSQEAKRRQVTHTMSVTMTAHRPTIPYEVAEKVRSYVYALRDPRDGRIFYVGKGKGARINSHLIEAGKNLTSERAS